MSNLPPSSSKQPSEFQSKTQEKLRRESLEEELKEIIEQIKETYYEYLSSLKFQNLPDHQPYKETMRQYQTKQSSNNETLGSNNNSSIFDVDNRSYHHNEQSSLYHEQEGYMSEKQSIYELELKSYSFEEELSIENKGYMCFVRLLNNLKQLQDYNHLLRSVVMNSEGDSLLGRFEDELVEDLKRLEVDVPACYFGKKA